MKFKREKTLLFILIILLGVVDSAWIFFYYNRTITSNVIGGEKATYSISQQFNENLVLDSSSNSASNSTIMKISNLSKDLSAHLSVKVNKTNLDSECSDYKEDCTVIITQILPNGTKNSLVSSTSENPNGKYFTLFEGDNYIEYNLSCVKNSCPQKIISNITIEGN
jgi:hypothetical protein